MAVLRRDLSFVLCVSLAACGGGTDASDSGSPGIDASGAATDAPVSVDAPGAAADAAMSMLDAPGLDAPSTGEDARTAEDAPSTREDAPVIAADAPMSMDDAASDVDAFTMGAFCGGIASIPCRDRRQYCDESCAVPDAGGVCRDRPTVCTDEVMLVCGCDGTTYGNPCMAAMAGVSVRSSGACPGAPDCRVDGCRGGQECCTGGRSAGRCYDPRCLSCCM
jgi:hypothetical protein